MSALVGRDCKIERRSSGIPIILGEVPSIIMGQMVGGSEAKSMSTEEVGDLAGSRVVSSERLSARGAAITPSVSLANTVECLFLGWKSGSLLLMILFGSV